LITDLLKLKDYTPLDATVSPFLDFDPHTNKEYYMLSSSVTTKYTHKLLVHHQLRSTSMRDFMTCLLGSQPIVCQRPEILTIN
ncbi:MAG: hypothetical protein ACKPKO_01180, partial [Candidatus Fonsibacter sp.]